MARAKSRALWILIPSLVTLIVCYTAAELFPERWGGPNIGGGFIVLMAYIGVAAGLVHLTIAWRQRRRDGR